MTFFTGPETTPFQAVSVEIRVVRSLCGQHRILQDQAGFDYFFLSIYTFISGYVTRFETLTSFFICCYEIMRKNSQKNPLLNINESSYIRLSSLLSIKSFDTGFLIERMKIKLGNRQSMENFHLKKILKAKIEKLKIQERSYC